MRFYALLFVLSASIFFLNPGFSQTNETDSLALVALYNATDGDNWTNNSNWLTGPVDTWFGIFTIQDRVTEIILLGNQLTGSIPPELVNLSNLVRLNLSVNQLTGSIPPELGNSESLVELYLKLNQLTGSIPPELGNLNNLEWLDLSDNQLTGSIPPELDNLSNLGWLDLAHNQLTGSIPQEIGNLSNLERLLLRDNQLTGSIPPEIGNLTNLTYLSLTRNQLSGTIPESIANLSSLETLALGGNQITGTVPIFLGDLSTINEIYLWGNQLTGSIPSEIGQLSNLTDLWLNDNDLSESLPESLGQLDNLEDLILYNNEFSGTLPESIGNISTLDRIAINTIPNLTGPIPDSWTNLNLSLFFFEETNLCEPDNTTFSNWKASIDDYSGTEIQCTTANANPTIADQTFGIDENSDNGTSIGTVIASDPDDDPLTYSITAGNTGTTFAINSSTGELTIADNTLLDFETNPSFGLSVAVDDGNSGSASGTITVNLIQNQVLGTVSTNPSFVIYPNPVTNKFSLAHSSEFDEIILMSLDGSALKKFHVNLSNEYDIADLNTGTYLLTGKNGNKTIHIGRIIKQ